MGNSVQPQTKQPIIQKKEIVETVGAIENKEPVNTLIDENIIFEKILDISNSILSEYKNDFLKEDFCSKLALIYEKKLSNFNIKILKSLYNNINSKDTSDNELIVTLQNLPNNDEKFTDLLNVFQENLKENFWDKRVQLNPDKIINSDMSIDSNNLVSLIKYLPHYIKSKHVNNLLNSKELKEPKEDLSIKVGGFIERYNKFNGGNKENNNNNNNNNNNETNNNINAYANIFNENRELSIKEMNNIREKKTKYIENTSENINNLKRNITLNKTKLEKINNESINNEETKSILKNINELILKNSLSTNSQNKNKQNTVPNKQVLKINKINEINENDKFVNNMIKYSVPKKYKEPTSFCDNKEKCQLTKKELCAAISENFIVRNNIIAAILTTIPYKNEYGQYEDGICYQKFLNLSKCKICVPYDYRNLKNKNINEIIKQILEKADDLDEQRCRTNQGFFLKLSEKEIDILHTKSKKATEESIKINPKLKYNLFFTKFTKKLRETYFTNLNSLITILEKMKETPIINNKTLNILSNETKNIIDNMYNLCHYYYVYAIISLINSDITDDIGKDDQLESIVSKALVKNN